MWSSSDPSDMSSKRLIVGLGNPGLQYDGTRHNAGFLLVDALVNRWSAKPIGSTRFYDLWTCQYGESHVYLMKPLTFMNLSGYAVAAFLNQHPLPIENMLVAYDDVALETGQIRLRSKGSSGGQKGIKHIIEVMGNKDVPRLRLGVGLKPAEMPLPDFVLADFDENQRESFENACQRACEASEDWLKDSMQIVMSRYNARVPIENRSQEEKTTPVEGGE